MNQPAVKESLTPQPATGQSKTPRTDQQMESVHMFDPGETVVSSDFARTLETELAAQGKRIRELEEELQGKREVEIENILTRLEAIEDDFDLKQYLKVLAELIVAIPEMQDGSGRSIGARMQEWLEANPTPQPLRAELNAALAERDEARRLLGEAKEYLEHMRLIANGPVPISGATLFKVEEIEYQITNHLKTA